MSVTVLNWASRHRCQGCGARSKGHSVAGDMLATPDGWLCPRCATTETCNSPAREVEPAPPGATIADGGAHRPAPSEVAA